MLPKPLRISPSAGKIDIIVPAQKLSRGKRQKNNLYWLRRGWGLRSP